MHDTLGAKAETQESAQQPHGRPHSMTGARYQAPSQHERGRAALYSLADSKRLNAGAGAQRRVRTSFACTGACAAISPVYCWCVFGRDEIALQTDDSFSRDTAGPLQLLLPTPLSCSVCVCSYVPGYFFFFFSLS